MSYSAWARPEASAHACWCGGPLLADIRLSATDGPHQLNVPLRTPARLPGSGRNRPIAPAGCATLGGRSGRILGTRFDVRQWSAALVSRPTEGVLPILVVASKDTDTPIRRPGFNSPGAAPAVGITGARLDPPCLAETGCGGRRSAHRASRTRLVRAAARSLRAARSDRTKARAPRTSAARRSTHGQERSGPSCFPSR